MLAGAMPLGPDDGVPVKVQWQAGALGWQLDDLVVSMQTSGGLAELSLSIKSDKQVTRRGFEASFVGAAWAQWLATEKGPFRKDRDLLGLATTTLGDDVQRSWDTLANQAKEAEPAVLVKRLGQTRTSSRTARALFNSLRCPREISAQLAAEPEAPALLLRHLRVLPFDLKTAGSIRRSQALEVCARLLKSGSAQEAADLWRATVAIAADKRKAGGTVERQTLAAALAERFALHAWPDLRSDWDSIRNFSRERASQILTTIAGNSVARPQVEETRTALGSSSIVVVAGDPGVGKSAVVRTALSAMVGVLDDGVVWFDPPTIERSGLAAVTTDLDLRHPLVQVLTEAAHPRPVIVLDAVEQYGEAAHGCAQALLSAVSPVPRWRVVLSIRRETLDVAYEVLSRAGIPSSSVAIVEVPPPSEEQIRRLVSHLPHLTSLARQPDVAELFRNLKVLDWVAQAAISLPKQGDRLTHSAVLDSVWTTWMGRDSDRHARAGLLKRLAVFEADAFASGIPLSALDTSEHKTLPDLERLALLTVHGQRAYFRHDLLGDLARQKQLEEEPDNAAAVAELARVPRWHHAIRLYGQARLEAEGITAWQRLDQALPQSEGGRIARDLLLEAIVTSSNVRDLLEQFWPELAKTPTLLERLLRRFGWIASRPSPALQVAGLDRATADALAALVRIPYWPYWPPFLHFLVTHASELATLARSPTADLVALFLGVVPVGVRGREEAARVAVEVAKAAIAETPFDRHEDKGRLRVFEGLLLASPELTDEVVALADRLVRVPVVISEDAYPPLLRHSGSGSRSAFVTDASFRQALLKTDCLLALARVRPGVAERLLLDSCKEGDPDNEYLNDLDVLGQRRLGLEEGDHGLEGPLFDRGPFLGLLRHDADSGVRCAIALVNHATTSWARFERPRPPLVPICLDGTWAEWIGDHRVFGWYRQLLMSSNLLASCLMALEKWLYDEIEAGRDVGATVERILRGSNSVAFCGVLVALALKSPQLLKGPLLPIVSAWRVFRLQEWLRSNGDFLGIQLLSFARLGEIAFNAARDWNTLQHRKLSLQEVVVRLMLEDPEFAASLERIRTQWASRLKTLEADDRETLELLIARFDPSNYYLSKEPDGRVAVRLAWPEHLREKTEKALARTNEGLELLEFPLRCEKALKEGSTVQTDPKVIWAALQKWDHDESSLEAEDNRRRFDALAAGAAVLWLRHREWLKTQPTAEEWCLQAAGLLMELGAPKEAFSDGAQAIAPWHWLGNSAQIAIARFSENPDDASVRELAANAITTPATESTAVALERAFRLRAILGVEFPRLVNLAVLWAGLRTCLLALARNEAPSTLGAHWRRRLIKAFVLKRVPSDRMPWVRLSDSAHRLYVRLMRRLHPAFPYQRRSRRSGGREARYRARFDSGFDFACLEAAVRWLPGPEQATTSLERGQWVDLHEELLGVSMAMMPAIDNTDVEVEGTPHDIEYRLYDRLCRVIPQLDNDEKHQRLWTPILDLGGAAHYWVQAFLDRWALAGPAAALTTDRFFGRWKEFIEYAFKSPAWQRGSGWRVAELWHHLLGMSGPSQVLREETHAAELLGLLPLFQRWSASWLDRPDSGAEFAWFLAQPGARELRASGLLWLSDALEKYGENAWRDEKHLEERLTDLLRVSWLSLGPGFRGEAVVRAAFLNLLAKVTERGSPAALDLRDRVRRSVRTLEA
jgi:hypothetical protein